MEEALQVWLVFGRHSAQHFVAEVLRIILRHEADALSKIDPVVALIMALARALLPQQKASIPIFLAVDADEDPNDFRPLY